MWVFVIAKKFGTLTLNIKTHNSWLSNYSIRNNDLAVAQTPSLKFLTWAWVLWCCHVATKWRSHGLTDAPLASTFPLVLPCHHLLHMQFIIIGNAPFSNTPLPSSFMPAADNHPLLYMTSKGICDVMIPMKKSEDGQAKPLWILANLAYRSKNEEGQWRP